MERGRRLVLLLLAVSLLTSLFWKGHGGSPKGKSVAFLRYTTPGVAIRLKGDVPSPGVYKFCDDVTVGSVINVTVPQVSSKLTDKNLLSTRLNNGDILHVLVKDRQHLEITINKMKAKERMMLGIPLHPDSMDLADWDSLPGIGPGLAKNIMIDRQKYGDFGTVEALRRVPGIGEGKLKEIARYFKPK